MSDAPVALREQSADAEALLEHLSACSASFHPPLAERVDLAAYAGKLRAHAVTFEAWSGRALVGLVATYMNDPQRRAAFVTSVSVAEAFAGRGVGRALLDRCITRARSDGFAELRLEVSPRAEAALALYRRAGFVETERRADVLSMLLPLATHEEPR